MKSKRTSWSISLCCAIAGGFLGGCSGELANHAEAQNQLSEDTGAIDIFEDPSSFEDPNLSVPTTAVTQVSAAGTSSVESIFKVPKLDSRLLSIAPHDCMLFATWPAWEVKQESTHPADRMIADKMFREPFEKLIARAGLATAAANSEFAGREVPEKLLSALIGNSPVHP